ncbi:dihydrolipoyl dehydrogenase family protein [Micromonospora sp. SL1-18]|uniref:dihydrolipoyl dehydrogenase family protein n=1 Tax=Micromonospora sp. SL1-18 TaxID=3399128 RepID=UPI003A4D6EF4
MTGDCDLVVIGGGAAGLGAARAAARSRVRVLLVSDGPPGGDCTFTGCVPSKALIEAAVRGRPFPAAAQQVRDAIDAIAATENPQALRREGIDVMLGRARFVAPGCLHVDGQQVSSRRFVIATGATPFVPAIPGLAEVAYLTHETVFDLTEGPGSLAVLGGGAVGCELAQAFARLGARVTVIEAGGRLLAKEEPEASRLITEVFTQEGIDVRVDTRVDEVATDPAGGVRLALRDGGTVTAQRLLVAVGRTPVTDGLGLSAVGVAVNERGYVVTDDHLATTAAGVYAAGDVTGRLPFTHAAFHMGRIAAGNALSRRRRRRYDPSATPWVTFTDPEVARVGLTEAQAAPRGARVAWLPMTDMDRAVAADRTQGFVKLLAGPRPLLRNLGGGRILGATIVAARAGEMIHEPALAMETRMFTGRLAAATHAYPTWSYGIQLTAAQFFMPVAGRHARPARG